MRNLAKDEIEMAARREAMLREGFRLFAARGIEPVSMQEVADACSLGVATLYRYYNTKLALVIAIGARQWEDYGEHARALWREQGAEAKTAAEDLELYLDFYIDLYRNYKDLLRFNQNFNNYVQHEGATPEQLRTYLSAVGALGRFSPGIYEKGKRDGTIRTDIPAEKMFSATSHIMLAVAVRYAQGLLFSAADEADRTEEFELLKRALLREYVIS
jgi:AcrR family transcriptional regulator